MRARPATRPEALSALAKTKAPRAAKISRQASVLLGELESGESEEIGGCEKAQVCRSQIEICHQIGCDHRINDAVKVGEKISDSKRDKDA
jgi:hypothetical protein